MAPVAGGTRSDRYRVKPLAATALTEYVAAPAEAAIAFTADVAEAGESLESEALVRSCPPAQESLDDGSGRDVDDAAGLGPRERRHAIGMIRGLPGTIGNPVAALCQRENRSREMGIIGTGI